MSLTVGSRFGPYDVVSPIGAGGMGEVFRARDGKLRRDVALKVLPEAGLVDPDRLARFEREGQVLASLNHPCIAQIFGVEEAGPVRALVMELVEGPTLADRIAPGPMASDEVWPIARQIVDALEAAHDNGVVHRDLKPANIKIRPDGRVKVLDFGLARVMDSGPARDEGAELSTVTSPALTRAGVILGTAAYMSPEQAKGHAADTRSDVWAFGCVLYEMLAGRRAFSGDSVTETLAHVLKAEPDWSALPSAVPPAARRLLRRCLEKDPRRRLRAMADAGLEIDEAARGVGDEPVRPAPTARSSRLTWATALIALSALLVAIGAYVLWPPATQPVLFAEMTTPPFPDPDDAFALAVSPEGRRIAFIGLADGQPHIWVRAFDSFDARVLPGTAGASWPFWSPDGRSLGFFADGWLKRIDLDGERLRLLSPSTAGAGGTWSQHGLILFTPTPASPVWKIPAEGGTAEPITALRGGDNGHWMPQFLPDGRHFMFFAGGAAPGEYLASVDEPAGRIVLESVSPAVFGSGHLFFVREDRLLAQPFDTERLELDDTPFEVAGGLSSRAGLFLPRTSVASGVIAFRVGEIPGRHFVWADRSGAVLRRLESGDGFSPNLSPDGRHVAVLRRVEGNADVWALDLERGAFERVTTHPAEDIFPSWSRDGRIAFTSNRDGHFAVYQRRFGTAGDEREEVLVERAGGVASDWSDDGEFVLLMVQADADPYDIFAARVGGGDTTPVPVVQSAFDERNGQFSPDGRWIAYQSNRTGRFEVYVQPFPGPGNPQPVSTGGGAQPRWRADGRELFYLSLDGTMMSVEITPDAAAETLSFGTPRALFPMSVGRVVTNSVGASYDVSADGKQFLMSVVEDSPAVPPLRFIANWRGQR